MHTPSSVLLPVYQGLTLFDVSGKAVTKVSCKQNQAALQAMVYSTQFKEPCVVPLNVTSVHPSSHCVVAWEKGAFVVKQVTDIYQAKILQLYHESKSCDRIATGFANVIESLIVPSLSVKTILLELFQNADDAPNVNRALEVQVRLENGWLIFSHTGREFTEGDVESISTAAQSTKADDLEVTGHKGIGFKALFSVSDDVYVLSSNYQFCFKKHYEGWKDVRKEGKYPWQVIPIPVLKEAMPKDLVYQKDDRITFAIKLRSDVEATECQEQLDRLLKDASVCLFLKNVLKVRVADTVVYQRGEASGVKWRLHTEEVDLPLELLRESPLPKKYLRATKVPLSFAMKLDSEGRLVKAMSCSLFCKLPSDELVGLPFLVDSWFFLDNSRTKLHANVQEWNGFLIESMAYYQFVAFKKMGSPPECGELIRPPLGVTFSRHKEYFQGCYRKGFERALKEIDFVPSAEGKTLFMHEAIFDPYGFLELFGNLEQKSRRVHSDFCPSEVALKAMKPMHHYNMDKIAEEIVKMTLKEPSQVIQLLNFIYEHHEMLPDSVKTAAIFLSDKNECQDSQSTWLPLEALGYNFTAFNGYFLHRQVYAALKSDAAKFKWLKGYFVFQKPELIDLILEINSKGKLPDRVDIVPCVHRLYVDKVIEEQDLILLKELKIKTGTGFKAANECYLHEAYSPKIAINGLVRHEFIVSAEYLNTISKGNYASFGEFLVKLGVHNTLNPVFFTAVSFEPKAIENRAFVLSLLELWRSDSESLSQLITTCKLGSKVYLETKAGLSIASESYLPDTFEPEEKLEKVVLSLPFVDTKQYPKIHRSFLLALGVCECIKVEVINDIAAIEFVRGGADKDKTNLNPASRYYPFLKFSRYTDLSWSGWEERKLQGYVHFPFSKESKQTPYFWQKIRQNLFYLLDAIRRFEACGIGTSKRNPVRFLLQGAVLGSDKSYGNPEDFLSPEYNELVGTAFKTPLLGQEFTREQYTLFGFRQLPTRQELILLLKAVYERQGDLAAKKRWLSTLYQWLLLDPLLFLTDAAIAERYRLKAKDYESALKRWFDPYVKSKKNKALEKISAQPKAVAEVRTLLQSWQGPFLTCNGQFIERNALKNENPLWKPETINPADFKRLMDLFQLPYYPPISNEELGEKGEEAIYEVLKRRYAPVTETVMGFTAEKASVIWHRKFAMHLKKQGKLKESNDHFYYECDFTVMRKEKKEKRIEVKSSRDALHGFFSKRELKLMKEASTRNLEYRVYHLRGLNTSLKDNWKWKKIKNITHIMTDLQPFTCSQGSIAAEVKDVRLSFEAVEDSEKPL